MDKNVIKITRETIKRELEAWQKSEKSTQEIFDWAQDLFGAAMIDEAEYDDWEGRNSVSKEILGHLDNLDMNLVVVDDVPHCIAFLSTPVGKFEDGWVEWKKRLEVIDYKERQERLRTDLIYKAFCGEKWD